MQLNPQNVFVKLKVETQKDLFKRMGEFLTQNGCVRPSFIEALVEREKNYPTGLPGRDFGIAMPHVDPQHVIVPGIAVATLEAPIPFVMMGTEDTPVEASVIFMLMLKDFDEQIDWLKKLMGVIQNHDLIAELMELKTSKDLYRRVREVLG